MAPRIGITVDNQANSATSGTYESAIAYSHAVAQAGGLALLLPHGAEQAGEYVRVCDGIILTGGVDPDTRAFDFPLHEKARVMDQQRQAFEIALLDQAAKVKPHMPMLGVCLGMQLMALHAGGRLNQYLPDTMADAKVHAQNNQHQLNLQSTNSVLAPGVGVAGVVVSSHRQAVDDPGSMRIVATAADGVIEAIDIPPPGRRFYLGVQWHPERGGAGPLNRGLIRSLVDAACQRYS